METALRAALIDWLASDPALTDHLNIVAEEAIVRATPPWLALVASASTDWSTKTQAGRELRVALELHTRGNDPAGDGPLVDAIERRIEALPRAQSGFAIASIAFLRARAERRADNARGTLLEYRMRCLST
ncbi:DUF3168 domain-containing protein [Erythrobacter sp. 3-20A1M]|nr:DUF3168 domain-containing protein [Erythrobacter sp. 3-20A1M]QWC58338.1 DUF3168 domain-containing protein [Erythrobacter sp. 3-20A1M]